MKKLFTLLFTLLSASVLTTNAQCVGDRYKMQVFGSTTITSDIQYGSNISYTGSTENLTLDVYEPTGDTQSNRPLMIIAHGGNFTGGSKTGGDVVTLAQDITKMGYVVASINYRKGFEGLFSGTLDSVFATETVVRAVHDYRAAIRFFKKDFTENGNTYGIDTSLIFASGVSAGAISAVHVGYMDQLTELPTYIDTTKAGLGGGIEGLSGNPGYVSSGLAGIINIAGALRDSTWITPGSTPLVSLHGNLDGTVPYGTDIIWLLGTYQIMRVDGSASMAIRANNVGLTNCFYTYWGADHVPHVGSVPYTDTTETVMRNFMASIVCGIPLDCSYNGSTVFVGIKETAAIDANVYPVPANEILNVQSGSIIEEVQLINMIGETVISQQGSNTDNMKIARGNLPAGMYVMIIKTIDGTATKKISFE